MSSNSSFVSKKREKHHITLALINNQIVPIILK